MTHYFINKSRLEFSVLHLGHTADMKMWAVFTFNIIHTTKQSHIHSKLNTHVYHM